MRARTLAAASLSAIFSLSAAETLWRTPLEEAGQSGIRVQGDNVYLTVHAPLTGVLKGGLMKSSGVVGQCFDARTGRLKWKAQLPGNHAGTVLESWHDSTSLAPVADAERIIFQNLNGMILCCDHAGRTLWKRAFTAPEPDIKNARMFLRDGKLIVALPSKTIAVPANDKHDALPFYQMHALNLADGTDLWVSPVLQSHATQYSLGDWRGTPVIVTSLIELTHWKFSKGRWGYLLSLKDGKLIYKFPLPPCIPHQKNQLVQGKFLVTVKDGKRTLFKLVDPVSGKVTREIGFIKPHRYFAWTGKKHELREYAPQFINRALRGRKYPTPSTMHSAGDRIFYLSSSSPSLGCVDLKTGRSTLIDIPVQVLKNKTVWNVDDIEFTRGVQNPADKVVNNRSKGQLRGPQWGGYGHVNPAWPIRHDNALYWQGGIGTLFRINLTGEFAPNKIAWASIAETGGHWTFGAPAAGENDSVYLRSQLQLVKLRWHKN